MVRYSPIETHFFLDEILHELHKEEEEEALIN